jgi:hypothetical protein
MNMPIIDQLQKQATDSVAALGCSLDTPKGENLNQALVSYFLLAQI